MRELVRTNDPVLVSAVEALLTGAEIPHMVVDGNMSVLEGSITAIQIRILVRDDNEVEARELLVDTELGTGCSPKPRRRRPR